MELNIEDEETCALVEELAQLIGVNAEEAITIAVRERLERIKHPEAGSLAEGAE